MQAGLFLCGVGIQIGSDVFQMPEHLVQLAAVSAFEYHMLNKMGQTFLPVFFIAGSGVDHNHQMPDQTFRWTVNDANAIAEGVELILHSSDFGEQK